MPTLLDADLFPRSNLTVQEKPDSPRTVNACRYTVHENEGIQAYLTRALEDYRAAVWVRRGRGRR